MNSTRRYAQYLWLVPVAVVLAAALLLARNPEDARFRSGIVALFEQAERVTIYPTSESQSEVIVSRGDARRFRALLHGVRDSYVAPRCPAQPDTCVDIYLRVSGPKDARDTVRRGLYHTTCGQLTLADDDAGPNAGALHVGPAFRSLVPQPEQPSQCPEESRPR